MYYIWTLDAHELWGYFPSEGAAHAYASHRSRLRSYCLLREEELKPHHWNSYRHYLDLAADSPSPIGPYPNCRHPEKCPGYCTRDPNCGN